MFLQKFILALCVMVAAGAAVMVGSEPAAAHYTDSLHIHGWTDLTLAWNYPLNRCFADLDGDGVGEVSAPTPDLMTTPVRSGNSTEFVAFVAKLEYYDFTQKAFLDRFWENGRWVYLPSTPWYYAQANNSGIVISWRNLNNNNWAPNRVSFNATAGYYRIHFYYYWYVDGQRQQTHDDVTNWCQV